MNNISVLMCAGRCGRVTSVAHAIDEHVVEVRCEECYVRDFGQPSDGFVGFVNGWVRTVQRGSNSPFEDPPMSDGDDGLGSMPLWLSLLVVLAFGVALAGLFAWALA